MGDQDLGCQTADLAAEPRHHPWVEPGTAHQPLRDVELDVGPKKHRVRPEKCDYLMVVIVGFEGVDQGASVPLGTAGQIVGKDVEDQ